MKDRQEKHPRGDLEPSRAVSAVLADSSQFERYLLLPFASPLPRTPRHTHTHTHTHHTTPWRLAGPYPWARRPQAPVENLLPAWLLLLLPRWPIPRHWPRRCSPATLPSLHRPKSRPRIAGRPQARPPITRLGSCRTPTATTPPTTMIATSSTALAPAAQSCTAGPALLPTGTPAPCWVLRPTAALL